MSQFLEDLKIKRITSSPYHPNANGQAESMKKVIIQSLKKRLEAAKGKWPEELPGVLWVYRTTAKSSTRETPFSLMYGEKALIPVEVGEPALRYFLTNEEANSEAMDVLPRATTTSGDDAAIAGGEDRVSEEGDEADDVEG
ncbi:uncharacterized protein LOC142177549 [Nicotiana tabacum]|uniref:Uncharacterized protein LOC142177549 n=1 Tax=Nicotiana tabacum TaxID=4097 RepID=A0AC58TZV0_TOBAC